GIPKSQNPHIYHQLPYPQTSTLIQHSKSILPRCCMMYSGHTALRLTAPVQDGPSVVLTARNGARLAYPWALCSGMKANSVPCRLSPSLHLDDCPGIAVVWPDDLRPFLMLFPWSWYHNGPDALPFTIDTRDPKHHTNYKFLSLGHMQDIVKTYADQIKQLKLQQLNHSCNYMCSLTQLDDYNCLLMAISEKDIPRIQQIEVVNKLEDALVGAYTPRGYGADDLDIATLVFRLGGRQLLFALNQSLGLPSLRTLHTKSTFTSIVPTIGPIQDGQFDQNIQNIVIHTRAHSSLASLRGISLMIGEIALEEMAVHFGKYNKVGGLCLKHSHTIEPVLRTYESAVNIAQKIHNGELHLGKELTVIGASCFGEDEIYPILAAPTCKTEDATDMEHILSYAIGSWNRTGTSTLVGPIWSLATDGDATRCAAGHKLFVKFPLPPESPLYGTLINLQGLNLFTGEGKITLDFDFKHIFKRLCTLIRAPGGIVINNGRVINSMMLAHYLAAVTKLLHPDDPQDDPRAIELMLAIIGFSQSQHHVLNDSFSLEVNTRADLISISLLSTLLESILTPFINVSLSLSLSEQFQYLSRYAHLAYAFFHAHQRSFMSYPLYYDTQTMVKNTAFSLSKQQSLDPHACFYLGNVGDDPLEILFGCMCMIGGHNSACSYAQAIDRLDAAKDINGLFKCHPELDPGHRCLKLTHHEGVDHINRDIWKGDIIADRCDLPLAWRNGRDSALSILTTSQLDPIHYSFADYFKNPDVNMLCPFRQNKYFGITMEEELEDTSRVPSELPPASVMHSPPLQCLETILSNEDGDMLQLDESDVHEEEDKIMLTFQEALINESPADAPSQPSSGPPPADALSPPLPHGPGIRPDDYLLYDGCWIHKQTNLFLVGDIFLIILHSSHNLSIGVLHSMSATLNGVSCASINVTIMRSLRSTMKITGQLLSVIPTDTLPDAAQMFLWDGGYITA
ncbi:uncharacterized protein EDB93DRAFT_1298960, partial [Suillus bovinus]|uniref:uncharacterized protein n=1 Tax=Suillus bovinus TaxID=48563 RepID=UPI001B86ECD3